jgi:transcriptional regulator with XRE-family HTH domain
MVLKSAPVNKNSAENGMIGDRIKEERERLGLTQPVFAEAAGAAKRTLIEWEKGSTSPNAVQLSALAAIGVDVQYILTGMRSYQVAEESPGYAVLDKREAALIENYRHIADEEDKRCVERTALLAAKADKKEGTNG